MIVTAGAINRSIYFYIVGDASHASPGDPITGLLFSDIETGGSASYARQGAARVDLTLITLASASAAHSDGGFIEVDATNMPGVYRCDYPDAAFVTGVDQVFCHLVVAAANNAAVAPVMIDITNLNIIAADVAGLDGDTMRGTDGANTTVPDAAGVAPTAVEIRQEIDDNSTKSGYALSSTGLDLIVSTATGMVEIAKAIWDRVLTGATHNIATSAGRRLRGIQEFQGYELGAIWVDTVNGAAGTIDYENGTVENAVLTWADALTLNASLGFNKFVLKGPTSIILIANSDNYHFIGSGPSVVALNGQSVIGITIEDCVVSGVMTGVGTTQRFIRCSMGAITMIKGTHVHESGITATQTVGEAGDYFHDNCHSGIAGTDTWIFNFGVAIGDTNANLRHKSGGVQFEAMGDTGTDTASIEGHGQFIEGTCTGGLVAIRGNFTTTGITNLTLSDNARFDSVQLVDDFCDEDISKSEHDVPNSLAKLIRQGGDLVQIDGAVSDVAPSTTGFDTNLTQPDTYFDDAVLIFSNGAANAGIGRPVVTYLNTDGAVTFLAPDAWPVTPVNGDDFVIYATHVHPILQIAEGVRVEMDDNSTQLAAAVALFTTQLTESYAANGVAPTPTQVLMLIQQALTEFAIVATSLTIKQLNGSTTAAVLILDDATSPTSATRSS